MKCRKCNKEMKIICSSSRSGRGGYSNGTIYQCKCGESCLVEGLGDVDWGDRYAPLREQLRKQLSEWNK
jgi:hypothetical protein